MLDGISRDFRFCCELGQDQAQAKTDEEQGTRVSLEMLFCRFVLVGI